MCSEANVSKARSNIVYYINGHCCIYASKHCKHLGVYRTLRVPCEVSCSEINTPLRVGIRTAKCKF